ncbi:TonB-dependent siderophore receptor [Parahaliea mediterranea]|uniref:TonB-dependent receptor n=1 Tax=Parahaliea mediterranea TaxID=651086 RepID=A0A939IJ84_9GAMM|nr:TonB-dependent receptor [Parahaliea mediterranea]MBN7796021.1 TonB-dependent receptor [Parahaliea mediterranea]
MRHGLLRVFSRALCGVYPLALLATVPAHAQRASENAVVAADDAFGTTIGNESIGLYSTSSVRGFSPIQAGNVRIEGIYFDRQGYTSPRFTPSSTIRVGLSAQGYLFPAPTGIVDYSLHRAGDEAVVSVAAGLDPYAAPYLEIDAKQPLITGRLGVAAGVSYAREQYYDGSEATYFRAGVVPRWTPTDNIEVLPFFGITRGREEETPPTIQTAGDYLPPEVERRKFFGQDWADKDSTSINTGVVAKGRFGEGWVLSGGIFRSSFDARREFVDLYTNTTADGRTHNLLIPDPAQRSSSTSGELRLSRDVRADKRLHTFTASARARRVERLYGGLGTPIDLGERQLGSSFDWPEPERFDYGERSRDEVRQLTLGLAYGLRWQGVGELGLGVQRADYEKVVTQPGLPVTRTEDQPLLFYGTSALYLGPRLALYGGYTRGLEESGVAPDNAVNRNEALPAVITEQMEVGLRWAASEQWRLIAGFFQVEKPYFVNDESGVYRTLGDVRNRGLEVSLTARPVDALTIVAGAALIDPRVTGEAVDEGRIGDRPVGETADLLRMNTEYRMPFAPGWSVDAAVAHYGERTASRSGDLKLPSYTLLDVGARYRFELFGSSATMRLQARNLTNEFAWSVLGDRSFGLKDKRRFSASLVVDF